MAENIGKILVTIEAEIQELQKGLKQAESEFKRSTDKMVKEQAKFSNKFKKSWVELQAKISVVTTALGIAEGVIKGISGAMEEFGNKGASGASKVGGAILAFGDAGIPIISQVIGVAEGLAEVFVQSASKIKNLNIEMMIFQNDQLRLSNRRSQKEATETLGRYVNTMATRYEILKRSLDKETDLEFQVQLARGDERENLEASLKKRIESISLMGDSADRDRLQEEKRVALKIFDETTDLMVQKATERQDAINKAKEDEIQRIKDVEIEANKRIAEKTMDLQTRLSIMKAEQAGDEEKAQLIAINARYDAMKKGATDAQKTIIDEMRKIEIAGLSVADGAEGVEDSKGASTGGNTASISTAIGSFTVATGNREVKKQTSLLQVIAKSSKETAKAVSSASGSGIVVPQ